HFDLHSFPTRRSSDLLLILEGAAIPKFQNDASYFSLGKSVVSEEFFRSHELTEEMVSYMRTSKEPGRAAGLFLLEQNFHSDISRSEEHTSELQSRFDL